MTHWITETVSDCVTTTSNISNIYDGFENEIPQTTGSAQPLSRMFIEVCVILSRGH